MANKQTLHLGSVTDEEKKRKKTLRQEGEGQVVSAPAAPVGAADPGEIRQAAPSVQDYARQLEDIYQQYVARQPFSYDMENDPLYRHYRDQYVTQGQRAMQDTMGQAAALTGGYGSTYADVAGQQAYGAYLQQLSALVPELYGKAWERYQAEGDRLKEQYSMVGEMAQTAYDREQDAYNRQKAEEQTAYDREQDAYNRQQAEEQTAYDREQDAYNRQMAEEQTAYDREQDEYNRQKAEEQTAYDREQDAYNRQKAQEQTEYDRLQDELHWQQQQEQTEYERQQAEEQTAYDREQDEYNRQQTQEQIAYDRAQEAYENQILQAQLALELQQAKDQATYDEIEAKREALQAQIDQISKRVQAQGEAGTKGGSSTGGSSDGSTTTNQEAWKDIGQTVNVGTPSTNNIKLMQTIFGVTADGVWDSDTRAAAGYKDAATAWQDLNNGKKSIKTDRAEQFYQDKGTRAQWKARGISDTEYDAMVTNWLNNSDLLPAEICWLKKQFVK